MTKWNKAAGATIVESNTLCSTRSHVILTGEATSMHIYVRVFLPSRTTVSAAIANILQVAWDGDAV